LSKVFTAPRTKHDFNLGLKKDLTYLMGFKIVIANETIKSV